MTLTGAVDAEFLPSKTEDFDARIFSRDMGPGQRVHLRHANTLLACQRAEVQTLHRSADLADGDMNVDNRPGDPP